MRAPSAKFTRRSMIGIIILIIAAVLINYVQTWRKRSHSTEKRPQILPSNIKRSAEIFDYVENYSGAPRFKVHAQRLLETHAGKRLLQGIEVCDFNPDGSVRNEIRSEKAEYDENGKIVDFSGDVRLFIRKRLEVRTDSLHYDLNSGIGETPDLLRLFSDQISGTARGIRFDQKQQSLALSSEVDLSVAQDRGGKSEKLHAVSQRAFCSQAANQIVFQGEARMESDTQSLSADNIEAILDPGGKRVRSLTASGNAIYESDGPGEQRNLRGDWIGFGISPAGTLGSISVAGQAEFAVSSTAGEDLQLSGREIHVQFDPKEMPLRVEARTSTSFQMNRGGRQIHASGDLFIADFASGTRDLQKIHIVRQDPPAKMSVVQGADSDGSELYANDIRVALRPVGGRTVIEKLNADGAARYVSKPAKKASSPPAPERSLSASSLELLQSGNGDYFESGSASGKVVISEESAEIKRLLADRANFTFFQGSGRLKSLDGEDNVQITSETKKVRSTKGSYVEKFTTTSDRVSAIFNDKTGDLKSAAQWGHFTYRDSTRSASSGRCDYDAGKELLILAESPSISDETQRTTGSRMDYDRKGKVLSVRGPVTSIFSAASREKTSFLGSSSSGSFAGKVTSREMQYWADTGRIRYTGKVRMKSENQQLDTDTLDISDSFAQVDAQGSVRHTLSEGLNAIAQDKKKGKEAQKASDMLTTVQSSAMRYSKNKNNINYSGKVTLHSQDVDLWSDTLDAEPDPAGKGIQKIHAAGNVSMNLGLRKFKGDTADYLKTPQIVIVGGNPANFEDLENKTGASARQLTYNTADGTILLDNKVSK